MTPYQVRLVVRRRSAAAPDVDPKPSRFEARWVESDGQMSKPFSFEPPLSDDDAADLRWYLEKFHEFVGAGTQARAANIEAKLDPWGRALYAAAFGTLEGKDVYRQALGVGQSALACLDDVGEKCPGAVFTHRRRSCGCLGRFGDCESPRRPPASGRRHSCQTRIPDTASAR
jgi:hypothetical protein